MIEIFKCPAIDDMKIYFLVSSTSRASDTLRMMGDMNIRSQCYKLQSFDNPSIDAKEIGAFESFEPETRS